MLRPIIYVLAIASASLLSLWTFPWWFVAIGALAAALLAPMRLWAAFGAAFGVGFAIWFGQAWILDAGNQSLLSGRVGEIFQGLSRWQLMQVTGFIGGLLSGLGATVGASIRPAAHASGSRNAYGARRKRRRR